MSARLYAPLAALLLMACATAQENPNYQYSSKYGTPGTDGVSQAPAPVQTASYQTPAPITYQSPAAHQPTPATSYPSYSQPAPVITASNGPAVSPTEQAYDPATMSGTPGYSVYIPEDAPGTATPAAPTPVSSPASGARAVDYDYSQNMRGAISAPVAAADPMAAPDPLAAPDPMTDPQAFAPAGNSYTVQPGDTVYSMSRRLCVPLSEITSANGIGSDYAISIGQALTLPASRC